MSFRIDPLRPPESLSGPGADDWLAYVGVTNAFIRDEAGSDLFDEDPGVRLAAMRNQTHWVQRAFVARDGTGRIIGASSCAYGRDGSRNVNIDVAVRPDARSEELEDALLQRAERAAVDEGRSIALAFGFARPDRLDVDDAQLMRPSSGAGAVPRDHPTVRFLMRNGYALGQVERASAFDLTTAPGPLRRMLDAALAVAGPDYEPMWWKAPTPAELQVGYSAALERLSTDVPSGDLDWDPERWDAQRVRDRDEEIVAAGRTWAVAAVVHRPTGALVAFNELVVGPDRTTPTENYGTLVLQEHRGRRLGTIVKCLGLLRWRELVPTSPLVTTFNAEENRFMLDVNEAVGFRPVAYTGEWQKTLT